MRKILLTIILLLSGISVCTAQSKKDDIMSLMRLLQVREKMDSTLESYMDMMVSSALVSSDSNHADEMKHLLRPIIRKIYDEFFNNEIVDIYEKHFTQDEIRECIKFYSTPAGKKFNEEQIPIQKEIIKIMIDKYIPEMKDAILKKIYESEEKEKETWN